MPSRLRGWFSSGPPRSHGQANAHLFPELLQRLQTAENQG